MHRFPRVSVITPVYNGEKWVNETLSSIAASTYPNFEMVVVNDGSTDKTLDVLQNFKESFFKNLVIVDKQNGGESDAVNHGVAASEGSYVMIVNADDPIYPHTISRLVEALEVNPQAVVAYPDWQMIDVTGVVIQTVETPDYSRFKLVCENNCLPGPGALIRRVAVEGNLRDTSVKFIPDYEAWLRLSAKGNFIRVPEVLATWRSHSGGATTYVRGAGPALEMVSVMNRFLANSNSSEFALREKWIAKANSYGRGAAQSLLRRGVPGRRFAIRSWAYASVSGRIPLTLDIVATAAIMINPLGLMLYRYFYRNHSKA